MLDGKTVYLYNNDIAYHEEIYSKIILSAGVAIITDVINYSAPVTYTLVYVIIDGKIRIDVPAIETDPSEYTWVTLLSETANSWTVFSQDDWYKDGSIDSEGTDTLYFSKPAYFPASL